MFWRNWKMYQQILKNKIKKREEEEQPWSFYPETRCNPPFSFSFISPLSLSLQSPLHSTSLCQLPRQQARGRREMERKREREKCADQQLSQLKNSVFLMNIGADLLHQLKRDLAAIKEPVSLLYEKKMKLQITPTRKTKSCCFVEVAQKIIWTGKVKTYCAPFKAKDSTATLKNTKKNNC